MKTMTDGERATARIAAQDRRNAKAQRWQERGPVVKMTKIAPAHRVCGDCNDTGRNVVTNAACFCPLGDKVSS